MEKGLKINHKNFIDLKNKPDKYKNYDWLYIGEEFCDNLLEFYLKNIDIIKNIPNKICFLSPPLTDNKIDVFKNFVSKIVRYKNIKEITINDIGCLNIISDLENVNLGRYLNKLFITLNRNLIAPDKSLFLIVNEYNIKRLELSFIFDKIKNEFYFESFKEIPKTSFTIYYPYFNLTTTMSCITGLANITKFDDIISKKCSYECIYSTWKIKLEKENFIINGNTIFKRYENNYEKILKRLKEYQNYGFKVDRIVEIHD